MNIIELLKQLEFLCWYDAGQGPKSGYSPCDDIRFKEALGDAWPKLLAVVEAAQRDPDPSLELAAALDTLTTLDE
jgi:hypothetical protein